VNSTEGKRRSERLLNTAKPIRGNEQRKYKVNKITTPEITTRTENKEEHKRRVNGYQTGRKGTPGKETKNNNKRPHRRINRNSKRRQHDDQHGARKDTKHDNKRNTEENSHKKLEITKEIPSVMKKHTPRAR
jgi:hypothetical protein